MAHTVCYYTDSTEFGGAEQVLGAIVKSLDRSVWRPVLLHHAALGLAPLLDVFRDHEVELEAVPPLPDGSAGLRALPAFVQRLRALGPAVFHANLTWPFAGKFGLLGALIARVPAVVATVHAFPDVVMPRHARVQRQVIAGAADRFIVASRYAEQRLTQAVPATLGKIEIVPNGIEPAGYRRDPEPELRARLTHHGDRQAVLVTARLEESKGHAVLFEACREMADVQIVLAGEGPARPRLESLGGALLGDRVTFLGFRSDIADVLAASDILVLPTLQEAFGLALLEGMAAAKPVIASAVGGPEEIIVNGETGLLVPPADPRSLAAAIRSVLTDADLALRLATAGRARVQASFTVAVAAERLSAIYDDVLRSSRSRAVPWRRSSRSPVQIGIRR